MKKSALGEIGDWGKKSKLEPDWGRLIMRPSLIYLRSKSCWNCFRQKWGTQFSLLCMFFIMCETQGVVDGHWKFEEEVKNGEFVVLVFWHKKTWGEMHGRGWILFSRTDMHFSWRRNEHLWSCFQTDKMITKNNTHSAANVKTAKVHPECVILKM